MTTSYSATQSFTRTHAKYLASKVVTDLYQCSRLYGSPPTTEVTDYEAELVELLVGGYVAEYEFGFKKNGNRVVSWQYTVNSAGDLVGGGTDDSAGGIYARAEVAGASHYNSLTYSTKWQILLQTEKDKVKANVPISRITGNLPADGSGYWTADRKYSNGGTAVARRTFRPS